MTSAILIYSWDRKIGEELGVPQRHLGASRAAIYSLMWCSILPKLPGTLVRCSSFAATTGSGHNSNRCISFTSCQTAFAWKAAPIQTREKRHGPSQSHQVPLHGVADSGYCDANERALCTRSETPEPRH